MAKHYVVHVLCLFTPLSLVLMQGLDYFHIESVSMCEEVPNQAVKFYLSPRDSVPGLQRVDINLTSNKPIGENTKLKCTGYSEINKRWIRLFHYEDDFCHTFNTYVGQLFYDMERAAGILPGTCPMPKGNYHIVNFTLDYQKLKLQSFPFGKMKYLLECSDKTTKAVTSCLNIVIVNHA
ncbi:hypothetical protein ILUMI_05880 [Ignelater luminosus]|uniref:MD-2-related lipid-recognition domain-containing protein n=1 Tax=Ignelater luminosus TaxID=2038154 RepID=A0A8K0DC75_IGNLU|nr:hypothetical protein ILUMI_05880 [Ignelater luminosus]